MRSAFHSALVLINLIFKHTDSWLSLFCPHSKPLAFTFVLQGRWQWGKMLPTSRLHTWPAHLVVPMVTSHHRAIRNRGNKNKNQSACRVVFPALSGIVICAKRWNGFIYLTEMCALWKADTCVRFIRGIFVFASVMHKLRQGTTLTMPEAICHFIPIEVMADFFLTSFFVSSCFAKTQLNHF